MTRLFTSVDTYNHLGIFVNNECYFSDRINSAFRKDTIYAHSDIGSPFLNPLTMAHMYKNVVRPTVLYACELLNLSSKDTQRLHVFLHSVCKTAQNLPRRTRSDLSESIFSVYPIIYEIDK